MSTPSAAPAPSAAAETKDSSSSAMAQDSSPNPAPAPTGPARVEDDPLADEEPVPPTSWPASCPSEDEEHVVSVVCGNSHLHWAFHHGIKSDVNPALFWRTPPLNTEDLSGSIPEALSRHLPQFAHDYIFGPGQSATSEAAKAHAKERSTAADGAPSPGSDKIAVYVISTNSDQVALIARLWRSIPCRLYLMGGDDFFSAAEGRYDTMGVDRLATLRGAAELHGFPALCFDGGTATTYTAADAEGRIMGGGIGPGLHVKFRSLNDYTDALPHISPDDVLKAVRDAVHSRTPLPTFGSNTKEAIMVDVLSELAVKGRTVIQRWLDRVGDKPSQSSGRKTSEGRRGRGIKCNNDRAVLVTGGDGEILTQLFQPDQTGIVDLGSSYSRPLDGGKYTIMHAKHLVHYGISAAIMRQVRRRRNAQRRQSKNSAIERGQKIIGQRVARRFDQADDDGDHVGRGAVEGVEKLDGEEVFLVHFDDGTKDRFNVDELEDMIRLYSEEGEKAPKSKRESRSAATPAKPVPEAKMPVPSSASSAKGKKRKADEEAKPTPGKRAKGGEEKDPMDYVGQRIAKDFGADGLFFGKITKYDSDEEGGLWHIVYDDGDEEDFEKKELKKSVKLYEKHRSEDKKAKKR